MNGAGVKNPNPSSAGRFVGSTRRIFWIAAAFLFLTGAVPAVHAQITTIQNGNRGPQNPQIPMTGPATTSTSPFQARRIQQLNVERQKEMVSDTDKLLKLIADLNADVAQSHSTTFTPDQLHMLAKIEKLAKSVREKMTNPVQGTIFEDNFPSPMGPPGMP